MKALPGAGQGVSAGIREPALHVTSNKSHTSCAVPSCLPKAFLLSQDPIQVTPSSHQVSSGVPLILMTLGAGGGLGGCLAECLLLRFV